MGKKCFAIKTFAIILLCVFCFNKAHSLLQQLGEMIGKHVAHAADCKHFAGKLMLPERLGQFQRFGVTKIFITGNDTAPALSFIFLEQADEVLDLADGGHNGNKPGISSPAQSCLDRQRAALGVAADNR
jgi:hypothetical protein